MNKLLEFIELLFALYINFLREIDKNDYIDIRSNKTPERSKLNKMQLQSLQSSGTAVGFFLFSIIILLFGQGLIILLFLSYSFLGEKFTEIGFQ